MMANPTEGIAGYDAGASIHYPGATVSGGTDSASIFDELSGAAQTTGEDVGLDLSWLTPEVIGAICAVIAIVVVLLIVSAGGS